MLLRIKRQGPGGVWRTEGAWKGGTKGGGEIRKTPKPNPKKTFQERVVGDRRDHQSATSRPGWAWQAIGEPPPTDQGGLAPRRRPRQVTQPCTQRNNNLVQKYNKIGSKASAGATQAPPGPQTASLPTRGGPRQPSAGNTWVAGHQRGCHRKRRRNGNFAQRSIDAAETIPSREGVSCRG